MISIFHDDMFVLHTKSTTYAFRVCPTGQMEHLYYGPKIHVDEDTHLHESHTNAPGNSINYNPKTTDYSLEDFDCEAAFYGKGDIREAMIEAVSHDGSTTLDFVFDSFELPTEKPEFKSLPTSYDDMGDTDNLLIRLRDKNHGYVLEMNYTVFNECDVITRSAVFVNATKEKVMLTKAMGALIDFPEKGYRITSFHGGWANEMNRVDTVLDGGKYVNSSFTGTSSSRSNPFIMMSRPETTEDTGIVYGFNIVYSGNHYSAFEVNPFGKTRFTAGINPTGFEFILNAGEAFEIPEVAISMSNAGFNGLSHNFHRFVRKHIVRGYWRDKRRPVLINSWEANYFNIDETKMVKLAKKAREAGIELFVMDDGWFGNRNNDTKGLGDWTPNKRKLPGGLKSLADKIHAAGMMFGIWVEPEMVNTDSDFYREHPDYCMDIPGMDHSEGRNQRILDLANPAVVKEVAKRIDAVLNSADINYVKWDMNRIVSDVYSRYLPKNRQGEALHRYVMGFYRLAKMLTEKHPEILFEGCASGGNRFDLGMLCYFPQIWASDNTDALSRIDIQTGYSYGYPQMVYTCHISSVPNHQTLREVSLETRAHVAFFGNLGVECNLLDMPKDEYESLKELITIYKKYRGVFQKGVFHRGIFGDITEWTVVSLDQVIGIGLVAQKIIKPSDPHLTYFAKGLNPDYKYHFYNIPKEISVKEFGGLLNMVSPVHVKQDSKLHNMIDRFYHLEGDFEDSYKYGDALMSAGARLTQNYIGTGVNNNVRVFKGGDSRLYFMEALGVEGKKDQSHIHDY